MHALADYLCTPAALAGQTPNAQQHMHKICLTRRRKLRAPTHSARYRSMRARSEHSSALEVLASVPLIMEMDMPGGLLLF